MLSELALDVIHAFGSSKWKARVKCLIGQQGRLLNVYQLARVQTKIPLPVVEGKVFRILPGKHNKLEVAIDERFGPCFASGAKQIYLGDTDKKTLVLDDAAFAKLGMSVPEHGKFSDMILYDSKKKWLFLIRAVTTHGPLPLMRNVELERLYKRCKADTIYGTAFLDFATY